MILKLMREFSKKIVYSGDPSNYKAWADAMWARGFNTSQEEVMNLLSVSRNWVVLTLLNEFPIPISTFIRRVLNRV